MRSPGAERPLETAGDPARLIDRTTWHVPAAAEKRWVASQLATWSALWDADTAVPQRIWGEGIDAPGAIADGGVAARAARKLLAAELAVLAPGARLDDFVESVNALHMDGKRRTVSFAQTRDGLPVDGARVGFLFAHDRIIVIASTAAPDLTVTAPARVIDDATAKREATAWISKVHGGAPIATAVAAPLILPIVGDRGALDARAVVPVTVELASPRGEWTVYVDAATGTPVARRQRLMFGSGMVAYRVPDRYPDGGYNNYPAIFADHDVDGETATSSLSGAFSWDGNADATVRPALSGPYAQVLTTGDVAADTLAVSPGGSAVWDRSTEEHFDAQLSAFIHTNIAKQFAKDRFDDELGWLHASIEVSVNEPDGTCNAFSTGDDIHFYPEGDGCANTARLADVVYHEFGHSIHGQSLLDGRFDSAFSEGISDVLAGLITGDPAMGLGFFLSDQPLRHIDPEHLEHRWPEYIDLDVHETGLIIAGAMWDLRKALIDAHGASEGAAHTEDLFYEMVRRSDGIPSSYVEALAADDDDGNLANGTPNQCIIDRAFAAHGLTAFEGSDFGILAPTVSDQRVLTLSQPITRSDCPISIDSATVTWRLRDTPTTIGTVAFDVGALDATAAIPPQQGGEVVQYQINATLDDGTVWTLPRNYADEWYELYVGPVTKLACWDMDTDPTLDGWQLTGDFEWGPAEPGSNGQDAPTAFSGVNVVATKLGGRGSYGESQLSDAILPEIDTTGYTNIHLQYRRWLVTEDWNRDSAAVLADGAPLWTNAASPTGQLDHRDLEWRFHDVDLTALSGNGKVRVQFQLESDADRQLGGWGIDDVCIVAAGAPVCGDERQTYEEECDDGNTDGGDGCSSTCLDELGPPVTDEPGCCSTGRGSATGTLVLGLLSLGLLRRRRV